MNLTIERLLEWLPRVPRDLVQRAPPPDAAERWRRHEIGGVERRVAQPVTFTPYAATRPCSARCRFCSENLRIRAGGRAASTLRPGARYFEDLDAVLNELAPLPVGYSLSGLEATDDPDWFDALAARLRAHARHSRVSETVLYTNGAGLCDAARRDVTLRALTALPGASIEWSRHHFDAEANQRIMRFRPGHGCTDAAGFEAAVHATRAACEVKLVCVVQAGGIDSPTLLLEYLHRARALGVSTVIFRELSKVDDSYLPNATARYTDSARCAILGLLTATLALPEFDAAFAMTRATLGYYFWNFCGRFADVDIVFEASDYARMHARHRTGDVYKLVLHANGNLCAGWNPERDVLRASAFGAAANA